MQGRSENHICDVGSLLKYLYRCYIFGALFDLT